MQDDGKQYHFGCFSTKEEAENAVIAGRAKLYVGP